MSLFRKEKKNPIGSFIIFLSQSFRVQLEKMPFQDNQHGLPALYRRKRAKFWKHSKSCWRKYDHMSNLHYATLAIHFCDGPFRNKVHTDFRFKFAVWKVDFYGIWLLCNKTEKPFRKEKKAVLTMVYTLMLLHVLLGLNVRQINLVWDIKSSLKGKLMLYVCIRIRLRQCSIS